MSADYQFSSRVHAVFWCMVLSGSAALLALSGALITGYAQLGFVGAGHLALAAIAGWRWMVLAEREAPNTTDTEDRG